MFRLFPLTYTRPRYVPQAAATDVPTSSPSSQSFDFRPSKESRPSDETTTPPRDSLPEHARRDESIRSGQSGCSAGIPDSLAFDKIMNGGTCPPMTVRDFMNYLVYVEHAAENLQFWLWYKSYCHRFETAKTSDLGLAPVWTQSMQDDFVARIRREHAEKRKPEPRGAAADMFKGTDFEKRAVGGAAPTSSSFDRQGSNPFSTPPHTPNDSSKTAGSEDHGSVGTAQRSVPSTGQATHRSQAANAFVAVGAKQPFTIQPFRDEINRVIATYIMDGAPRQLNLASWQQKAAVHALSRTTHPTALRPLFQVVDAALRQQAHPNFVRWSICNGNPARVLFARGLGVGLIAGGLLMATLMALSSVGRGYRVLAAIPLVLGISTLVAAYKGMCVVLHGMHHRHVRPWELFVQDDGEDLGKRSFDSFGSENSYEDEPWVVRYGRRNVVRKVFDREVWIQEPALRQIQDTIFVQAILASVLLGGVLTAIYVAVPAGDFF